MIAKLLVSLSIWLVFVAPVWAGHTLSIPEQELLKSWLARHSKYRIALDADCSCDDEIKQMRAGYGGDWLPVADYHPYVATGDFNGDGREDFAVVLINRSKSKKNYALLVFNGPFDTKTSPAFIKSGLELEHEGLFFGPPRPKPYRLIVGQFESDTGSILIPDGQGYKLGG